jgi:glycine cleavage system H protein
MTDLPQDMLFTEQHEWVKPDGNTATVGITDFAQQQLGDMTFVELPPEGEELEKGAEACAIESCKAAASVYAPAAGKIVAVNNALEDDPGLVNSDPYTDGWIYKIELSDPSQLDGLMKPEAYAELLSKQD